MASSALVGKPDGPMKFVPELGCSTGTFTDLPASNKPCVMWHVPFHQRGTFRPDQLANYDPKRKYRVNDLGYLKCYAKGKTPKGVEKRCGRLAMNRTSRCIAHGGELHPLDKRRKANDFEERSKAELREQLSRKEQFERKLITVEDLDDEELALQGFRDWRGNVVPLKLVPREMNQAFIRAIYDRASRALRSYTVKSVETLGELATDKNVDPAIRLRAAQDIIDRNLGKAPQNVAITVSTPYEEIFDAIGGITRAESRRLRQKEIGDVSMGSDSNGNNDVNSNGRNRIGESLNEEILDVDIIDGDNVDNNDSSDSDSDLSLNVKKVGSRLSSRNPAILAQSWELPTKLANVPTVDDL